MNYRKPNWFVIFSGVAAVIVLFLYFRFHIDKQFIGIVEARNHLIGTQEPGTVRSVLVKVGDSVVKGQVLATLDVSDLESQISQLKGEISSIEELKNAHEDRYFLEYQRLATNLADRLSLLESKRVELRGLNTEIDRLKEAEDAGLGHSRDLADLVLQRDVLKRYLEVQSTELRSDTEQLDSSRKNRYVIKRSENDQIVQSMLSDIMERTEDLRRELALTEHRLNLRTIVSPCDGFVVDQFAWAGDVVEEFLPVLSVAETEPRYVTVYLPEKTNIDLQKGMKVRVWSGRTRQTVTGEIVFIHPGLTQTTERISFRGQLFWARRVQVVLPEHHGLLGGEVVYARINHFGHDGNRHEAVAAEKPADHQSALSSMNVPENLMKMSRFEPSGLVWLKEKGRCLVVSDDTGIKDAPNDHAPFLFSMDNSGAVAHEPIRVRGIGSLNDVEAITSAGDGSCFLVSSQNISKKGKRPVNREQIVKIIPSEQGYQTVSSLNLLSVLMKSYSAPALAGLGLTAKAADGKPVINIEGAAWHDGALYLGLKQPSNSEGAIIWKLNNPEQAMESKRLSPGQLSLWGRVDLGRFEGRHAGISDLCFDEQGNLYALSTFANVPNDRQNGGLHRIRRFDSGRMEAETLTRFAGLKPEGLTFIDAHRLMIAFDNDNKCPAFTVYSLD